MKNVTKAAVHIHPELLVVAERFCLQPLPSPRISPPLSHRKIGEISDMRLDASRH